MEHRPGALYVGETIDPSTHERTGTPVHVKADHLTTHGVIVGMTGSGKTGLGIILLEEALLSGVPALVIDPKGDMGNLLLTFPELAPTDFEPWVSEADAKAKGQTVAELATGTAELWSSGLEGWGLGPDRIRALKAAADVCIYTPGSTAGVPLNIVGSLRAPDGEVDPEAMRDEIEGFVSSLLGLVGIEADPIGSREHVLLANIIEHAWTAGRDLDLATLILQVQDPPMRRLGVFEVDSFFPKKDRTTLAMRLNGLVASPSFEAWTEGPDLDVGSLLRTEEGKPRAAIVSLAHLSDEERQFVVTLLLSKAITWMRAQSGTSDLRALIYMDEVFGFVPPTAAPPSKKPILTILKQARAFGMGMVLSTQNPVDVDYKALSNAGTWMIGRLQTERDKARLLEGLRSASGSVDLDAVDATISGLGKREFLLHSTRSSNPVVFGTRWAMSYLRGPLSREQIGRLMEGVPREAPEAPEQAPPAAAPSADHALAAPEVATGIPVYYLDPAAEWAGNVGANPGGTELQAAVALRVNLLYDESAADLRHQEEWEAILLPIDGDPDPASALPVDHDPRDFRAERPEGTHFRLPDAPLDQSRFWSGLKTRLKDHLYRTRSVEIFRNAELKLYSRVGETREGFAERCRAAADRAEDDAAAKLSKRFEARIERAKDQLAKAQDRLVELEADTRARRSQELLAGAGDLLSAFLGGRRRARSLASKINRAASRRSMTSRTAQRKDSAENRVEEKVDALESLEQDLADALIEIDEEWTEKADAIEVVQVGLEKTDVTVDQIALVWIPVA